MKSSLLMSLDVPPTLTVVCGGCKKSTSLKGELH